MQWCRSRGLTGINPSAFVKDVWKGESFVIRLVSGIKLTKDLMHIACVHDVPIKTHAIIHNSN